MNTSYLQKLWRKTSWLIYFRLQHIATYWTYGLELTPHAIKAVARYNTAVDNLKVELKKSYETNKAKHLKELQLLEKRK